MRTFYENGDGNRYNRARWNIFGQFLLNKGYNIIGLIRNNSKMNTKIQNINENFLLRPISPYGT